MWLLIEARGPRDKGGNPAAAAAATHAGRRPGGRAGQPGWRCETSEGGGRAGGCGAMRGAAVHLPAMLSDIDIPRYVAYAIKLPLE